MRKLVPVLTLAIVAVLGACGDDPRDVGVTTLSVVLANGNSNVQTIRQSIECEEEIDRGFADEVSIGMEFEVVDGRTSGGVPREIWQTFLDLAPGPCVVQLDGFDDEGERLCVVREPFNVSADGPTEISIVILCDVDFQVPLGRAEPF